MKKEKGFTLVELIISTAIGVLVGGLLLAILVNNTGVFYKESSRISEGVGINDSLANIRSSIKIAQAVVATYISGTTTFTSSSSELVLQIASTDSAGNIISNVYDYIVFTSSQNKLYYKLFPDITSSRKSVNQVLTNNVSSILFNYFDSAGNLVTPTSAAKIRVTISLSTKAGSQNEVNVATSEANLRND